MNRLNQKRLTTVGYVQIPTLSNNIDEIQGDGVIGDLQDKFIKKFLGNRPKVINDLIKNYGTHTIIKIEVCRVAVKQLWVKLINAMSIGILKQKMKERDYDKLFHLYVIIHLDNGDRYRIEKNQRMKIIKDPKISEGTKCNPVNVKLNLAEFIIAPEKVNMKNLYRYNAFSENCQNYVKRLLNANGITQFNDFILQNVKDLAPGIVQKIARGITDVAGVADYVIRGGEYQQLGYGMEDDSIYEKILGI